MDSAEIPGGRRRGQAWTGTGAVRPLRALLGRHSSHRVRAAVPATPAWAGDLEHDRGYQSLSEAHGSVEGPAAACFPQAPRCARSETGLRLARVPEDYDG